MQICSHLVPSLKLIINSFLTVQIVLFFVDDIVIVMKYIYLSEYASFYKSRVIIKKHFIHLPIQIQLYHARIN